MTDTFDVTFPNQPMQTLTDDLMGVTILYQRYIRDLTCIQVNEGAEDFHDRDTQRSVFFFKAPVVQRWRLNCRY